MKNYETKTSKTNMSPNLKIFLIGFVIFLIGSISFYFTSIRTTLVFDYKEFLFLLAIAITIFAAFGIPIADKLINKVYKKEQKPKKEAFQEEQIIKIFRPKSSN